MTDTAVETTTMTATTLASATSKRKLVELLRSSATPKVESHGRVSKTIDAEGLSLGSGVVVTGKLAFDHTHVNEDAAIKSLLDGTGMKATIHLQAGTKAQVWTSHGYFAGNVRAGGITGRVSTLIDPPFAFVGATVGGVGTGKGRVHMPTGVFVGAVEQSLPNGNGSMLCGKYLLRGHFVDGKANGRMTVTNLEDDSSYFAHYDDGVERLERRKMRKLTSAADYEDDENDMDEESVGLLKERLETLQEKIKSAEAKTT